MKIKTECLVTRNKRKKTWDIVRVSDGKVLALCPTQAEAVRMVAVLRGER